MPYPKELYTADRYRVVHGPEEEADFKKKGWMEDMPENHPYISHTVAPGEEPLKKRGPGRPKAE